MHAANRQAAAGAGWQPTEIRRLQLLSSRRVTSIFAGEYRSVFRGRGIEFEEVREYQPGDDIRGIDWNVTARSGRPFVKHFVEEREMTAMLLLDCSPSLDCRTPHGAKSRVTAEIVALLAMAAARSNDRVGLLLFTDRVERYVPPAKGPRHAQRLVADVLLQSPIGRGTDLAGALSFLQRVQRRGAILFVISDFLSADFRLPLAAAAKRHDVVAISVANPDEENLPLVGLVETVDAETGSRRLIDTGSATVRAAFRYQVEQRHARLAQLFAAVGVEHLSIPTTVPPVQALTRFFLARQRRVGR